MKKSTWRHFGYLEGLRKARNILRKQVKTIPVFDQSKIDQAVYARIQMEKFYTSERVRLFNINDELKKKYPLCIKHNNAGVGNI